jgi:hypothetical protein
MKRSTAMAEPISIPTAASSERMIAFSNCASWRKSHLCGLTSVRLGCGEDAVPGEGPD